MESLKQKILIRTVAVALVVGLVVLAVVVPPLYRQLKDQSAQTLSHLLKTRTLLANQALFQMQEVARQITSRSKIRDRLEAYNASEITLVQLQAYTRPLLQDALDKSRSALGIRRFDAEGKGVVEVGKTLPDLAPQKNDRLVTEGPFGTGENRFIAVTAPIHDRQNRVIGWDQVLFSLDTLRAVTGDYTELFKSGEAVLAKIENGRFVPLFELRSPLRAPLPPATLFSAYKTLTHQGWALSAAPLNNAEWWVIVRVPESELAALINQNVRAIVILALVLVLLAIPITVWLIAPLLKRLSKEFKDRLEAEAALRELNSNLERAIEEEIARRRRHEHILVHQARLAQMGEMIGAIAHQWRQPLNALALAIQDLGDAKQYGELNDNYLADMTAKSMRLIQQMSGTIDDFRSFFRSDRQKSPFDPARLIDDALSLLQSQLDHHNIQTEWAPPKTSYIYEGFPNEFKQVILNLITNARDAIDAHCAKNDRKTGLIKIDLQMSEARLEVSIEDNGGGIPADISDRIFDPYFTTKDEGKGVGLGLYMSKLIIEEHMGGTLDYENTDRGVRFRLTLPRSNQT